MPILIVILVLVAFGVILWAINRYVPMQQWVKTLLNIVVIIILVIWLLKVLGLIDILNVKV